MEYTMNPIDEAFAEDIAEDQSVEMMMDDDYGEMIDAIMQKDKEFAREEN